LCFVVLDVLASLLLSIFNDEGGEERRKRNTESVRRRKDDGRAETERREAGKDGERQRHGEEQRTASIGRETERKRRRGRLSSQEGNRK